METAPPHPSAKTRLGTIHTWFNQVRPTCVTQGVLAPILLRRMKEDVETLPEKEEVIVWVELTQEQRQVGVGRLAWCTHKGGSSVQQGLRSGRWVRGSGMVHT